MLNQFHPSCLRRILKLGLQDRILDTGILERREILSTKALHWRSYLVRLDDEWLPRRFFCGDVVTGSRRKGDLVRRYKDTLNTSLRRLQINSANWEDLIRNRPSWQRAVKASAVIYETNRITAAKAVREPRKCRLSSPRNANARPSPFCPRCQLIFRAAIGLFGHLRTNCSTRTTPVVVPPSTIVSPPTPTINTDRTPGPLTPSSIASISVAASPISPSPHHCTQFSHTDEQQPHHRQHQECGLGPNMSSLRSHLHLTRRPGRSLANPSHRDWRTSAWCTHIQSPYPPSLSTLSPHIHLPQRAY
nr:unnamed protein product [Spirometra erinaceieuropaei]